MSNDYEEEEQDNEIEKRLRKSILNLSKMDDGRRLLRALCDYYVDPEFTSYVDGNPNGTAFNEGARYTVCQIRQDIHAALGDDGFYSLFKYKL